MPQSSVADTTRFDPATIKINVKSASIMLRILKHYIVSRSLTM